MLKCDALMMLVRVSHVVVNSSRDNLLQQTVFFFFFFFKMCGFTGFGNPSIWFRNRFCKGNLDLPLAVL